MKEALLILGAGAMVPYAWDSYAINQFSASQGNVQLGTFSGSQSTAQWEFWAAIIGLVLILVYISIL